MKYLSINLFSIEIGRPECLIGEDGVDERLGGTWYLINTMKLTATTTLFLLLLISSLCEWLRHWHAMKIIDAWQGRHRALPALQAPALLLLLVPP